MAATSHHTSITWRSWLGWLTAGSAPGAHGWDVARLWQAATGLAPDITAQAMRSHLNRVVRETHK